MIADKISDQPSARCMTILAVPRQAASSAPASNGWWHKFAWARLARSQRARSRALPATAEIGSN